MNLDHLRYFLEAARLEHFGKAAKALGISRSAISHSIADLEEEIGRELFARKGKNVFVTPQGKEFAAKLRGVLDNLTQLKEDTLAESCVLQGHFRLGATHQLCYRYLAKAWAELQSDNSRLTAEIYTMRSADVLAKVTAGELDFGLCVSPQSHPLLDMERVLDGKILITVKKGHPLLKLKGRKQLAAVSGFPAVLPRAHQGIELCDNAHPMFKKFGILPKFDCLVDSYDVALAKVAYSQSWAFLPDWVVRGCNLPVVTLPPPPGWAAPVWVAGVWQRTATLPRPLAQLLSRLGEKE